MFSFPLWVQVICWIGWACFIVFIIRGIYINYIKAAVSKRRVVQARLVSKVEEEYRNLRIYNSRSAGIPAPSPDSQFRQPKKIAYRLYFDVEGKMVELDVTKEIFQQMKEDTVGTLDYQGNFFYDFKV